MLGPWYVGDSPTAGFVVHVTRDGNPVQMDGYTSAAILLYPPSGNQVPWGAEAVINAADDTITIPGPPGSPFGEAGVHSLYLRLTAAAGGTETFFVDYIRVVALGVASGWATADKVYTITGQTVTDDLLNEAQGVIELYAGRTFAGSKANDSIRPKDKVWLEKAVAYQAIWQSQQPGYLTRHAIKEVNQDGAQIVYAGSGESNNTALIMLAPLAQRALKNVSWMRSRTIRVKPASYEGAHPSYGDYKRNDDHPGWSPM